MNSAYVKINAEAIRRHCVASGYTMADLARRMGRTQSYFSNCLSRGSISASAYPLLVEVAGVDPAAFLARETPPKTEAQHAPPQPGGRYSLTLQTKPDRIRLALCDGAKEISYAWSKLRGSSELDLAQAISYAAHLIYKFSEQRTLGTEDK
jgi:hypothetical protein|nr:MAG TPA: SOS-response transcriptional repressor [Caudoviricetes sp.]